MSTSRIHWPFDKHLSILQVDEIFVAYYAVMTLPLCYGLLCPFKKHRRKNQQQQQQQQQTKNKTKQNKKSLLQFN